MHGEGSDFNPTVRVKSALKAPIERNYTVVDIKQNNTYNTFQSVNRSTTFLVRNKEVSTQMSDEHSEDRVE
jgi:hypothetical protein